MFSKSIIYLLFPTIFPSISFDANIEIKEKEKKEVLSNQQLIEMGVEKVKVAFEAISIEELNLIINNERVYPFSSNKELKTQHDIQTIKNDCESKSEKNFCLN
ncbi:MAG: hypothetical protein OEW67_11575 [Cyclobacteriaceae bacterium]|nr:hypothetical protein [Cyclobacteriaceae bacterium]